MSRPRRAAPTPVAAPTETGAATRAPTEPATPPPTGVVELGSGWPGWTLRAFGLAVGVTAALVQAGDLVGTPVLVLLLAAAVVSAVVPASPTPALLIAAVAIVATGVGGDPLRASVLVEVPLLHLVHVVAALSAVVPLRARIHPRALVPAVRRFLLVQVGAFTVVGFAALLPTGRNPTVVEVVGLLAVTGLVLLAGRLLRRPR